MLERVIVFSIFFWFELVCVFLLDMVKQFIFSKPPGRRLVSFRSYELAILIVSQVTSDIHVILANALTLLFSCFSAGGFLRTLYGPLPFFMISGVVESLKWALGIVVSVCNVSSFMQVALLMDFG